MELLLNTNSIIAMLGILIISLGFISILLHTRVQKLSAGKSGASLESTIHNQSKDIEYLMKEQLIDKEAINKLQQDFLQTVQHVGLIRFNPYKDTGGSQSFALALLDKNNNGIVVSSLYTRDRMNVFAKAIRNGQSEQKLSQEEQQAMKQALLN